MVILITKLLTAKINDFKLFKNVLNIIQQFRQSGNITITNNGIEYNEINQERTSFISFKFKKQFFSEYNYVNKIPLSFSLDFSSLYDVIKLIPLNTSKLKIISAISGIKLILSFNDIVSTKIIVDMSTSNPNKLEHKLFKPKTILTIPYELFRNIINITSSRDYIELSYIDSILNIKVCDNSICPDIIIKVSDTNLINVILNNDSKSIYSTSYLNEVPIFDEIKKSYLKIEFNTNTAIRLSSNFNNISYTHMIAPKIEDE